MFSQPHAGPAAHDAPLTAAELKMNIVELALKKVFGLDSFRGQQQVQLRTSI